VEKKLKRGYSRLKKRGLGKAARFAVKRVLSKGTAFFMPPPFK